MFGSSTYEAPAKRMRTEEYSQAPLNFEGQGQAPASMPHSQSQTSHSQASAAQGQAQGQTHIQHASTHDESPEQPRRRIPRACDPCRRKRAKCSGETPCALCASKPHLCVYAPILRTKREPDLDDHHNHSFSSNTNNTSGSSKLDQIEHRLGEMERLLNRMMPLLERAVCLTPAPPHSNIQLQQQIPVPIANPSQILNPANTRGFSFTSPLPMDPPAMGKQPTAATAAKPHIQTTQLQDPSDTSYKTGGFLINTEETALTFWGSTSALGGTSSTAHLYKAIPRFINGILMVHIPATSLREGASGATPSSAVSGGGSRCGSIEESHADGRERVGSIVSLVSETKALEELIPLPAELLDHVLRNYWDQFHPQFPLIDRPWFDAQLKTLRSLPFIHIETHWRFVLLLTSVVVLMINFTPSLSRWGDEDHGQRPPQVDDASSNFTDHDTVLEHLLESYKTIFFDHFELADVISIQSLVIMVVTGGFLRGSRYTGTWGFMGLAVRLSQELGLHRSIQQLGVQHKTFDKQAIALRNRTWHCVAIMETYTCIWTGRPLAIHEADCDAEVPEVTSPEIQTFRYHIELAQIIAAILRFANRAQPTDVSAFATSTQRKLDSWWSRLDPDWQSLRFQERWNSKALMALMFHSATILFHRTTYARIDSPACLNAANAITTLVSRFEAPPNRNECIVLFPSFTYCAMMACTVHIGQMLSSSSVGDGEAKRFISAVQSLEKCMRVFDNLRGLFITAERCWKTVLDFLGAKGIQLDELVKAAKKSSEALAEEEATAVAGLASMDGGAVDGSWLQSFMDAGAAGQQQAGMAGLNNHNSAAAGLMNLTNPQKMQLQQLGIGGSFQNDGMGGGGFGGGMGLWDGLSLFDLAGLGGLAGLGDFGLYPAPQNSETQGASFPAPAVAMVQPISLASSSSFPVPNSQQQQQQNLHSSFTGVRGAFLSEGHWHQ
ncbi:hypothetical protein HDU98_009741 [Podochytrium sp. JEL0797]|nr:hypothetical protein HDU98_009741 [Podochytrium sp. JEL0797]